MKKAQNLNALRLRPNTIHKDEWRSVDYQLSGAAPASNAAHFRVIRQHVTLLLDLSKLIERRTGIVLSDIVDGMGAIVPCPR